MDWMVEMQQVSKYFPHQGGMKAVLDGVDLKVGEFEVVALLGPSGSGKSTCLRTLGALETIDQGDIIVAGIRYRDACIPVHHLRRQCAFVFQRFELFPHMTALDNVALGPYRARGQKKAKAYELAQALLEEVGLKDFAHQYPERLSGGQMQRVGIARALANEPKVLLCDEPTSALDPELVGEVTDILAGVAQKGMTMVVVTHEWRFARKIAHRCVFLDQGKVLEDRPTEEFFEDPQHERLKGFLKAVGGA